MPISKPNHNPMQADLPSWNGIALLTIDFQNDFVEPEGSAYVDGTDRIVPTVQRLVQCFRSRQLPIFHAIRLYLEDGSNAEHCRRTLVETKSVVRPGTHGSKLIGELGQAAQSISTDILLAGEQVQVGSLEWVFYKPRWSAFYKTGFEQWLTSLNASTLVVAGCNFPNCPTATLFDASARDFHTILANDAVSNLSQEGKRWCQGVGTALFSGAEIEFRIRAAKASE